MKKQTHNTESAMFLIPSLRPQDAPMLMRIQLPEEFQEEARSLWLNLSQMKQHCLEFSSSVALADYTAENLDRARADYKRSRKIEDPPFPEHECLWTQWNFAAGRSGGLALRNYVTALDAVQRLAGRVGPWRDVIDTGKIKESRKSFDRRFPGIHKIRHAIAHPEFFPNPEKEMAHKSDFEVKSGDFIAIKGDAGGSIQNAMIYGTFSTTFEGEMHTYDFNKDAAEFVVINMAQVFDSFDAVAAFSGAQNRERARRLP
eukprot:TRINITY_DN96848_c0_g1_i1.p1 TRINITY_DN96848_c0_g1~~TRINITY_DN96848_c0_g1_i1.p1  ORF type:complete len:258 (+),score=24.96 TRINITY_DN96848_c0_g1_i1:119-892(+)